MALNVNGGPLSFEAGLELSSFQAAISRIEAQLQGLTRTAEQEAKAIENVVQRAATAIAGYATFTAGKDFFQQIIRVRGEMEQLEVAFTTMLQSKEKADKLMQEIVEFAATTPFELKEVAGATKQLLAFGIPAEKIKETLRSLGDVSAGIGQPLGEIAYLFGTIRTQGTAFTQDVRQFAQRGIPIYDELAKILKVSVEEVGNFISAGKVGFPEIEQVFKNLTAAGSQFGGLMEAQSKTLLGQISNLTDAWDQMLNAIGKSTGGVISDVISALSFLIKNYQTVLDILKVLIITYGSYRAALVATNAATAISTALTKGHTVAELLRNQAILLSERAMKLLNATLLKNPIASVIAGIAALTSALIIFSKENTAASRSAQLLNDVNEEAQKTIAAEKTNLEALLKVARDETASKEARQAAVKKLNELAPEYLGNLTLENLKTKEGTDLVEKYISALTRKAKAQAISNKLTKLEEERIESQTKIDQLVAKGGYLGELATEAREKGLAEYQRQQKVLQDLQAELLKEDLKNQKGAQDEVLKTISYYDILINQKKKEQAEKSTSNTQFLEFQEEIDDLEAKRKAITGATKKDQSAASALENKINSLLEKRKDILEAISDKQKQSDQSGMTKQQSEIDKINESYDDLIDKVAKYNKTVDDFNKKNKGKSVPKIGALEIDLLNQARRRQITELFYRQEADLFKRDLEDKTKLFEDYEQAKKEVGLKKAKELYSEQLAGFQNLEEFLLKKKENLQNVIDFDIAFGGEIQQYNNIVDSLKELEKKRADERVQNEINNYKELLSVAATYEQKKSEIIPGKWIGTLLNQ